jgi:predicted CXXCH cytochrome family protein
VRKAFTALFAVACVATAAHAAKTPENVTFETTRAGNVEFPHKLHAARGCKGCHPASPAKLEGFGKDRAHELCKGCHENLSKGPTKCDGCHRR